MTCAGPGPGGIYCAAILVPGGTCNACSDLTTCTGISCPANKFNDDGQISNGCEAGCPSVAGATSCVACTSAATSSQSTCTALSSALSPPCDFKLSDDPLLVSTGGWNVLSVSCVLGSQITVRSGTTMRVKKDPLVSSPVVIDRQAMAYLPVGRHFYVTAGTLEMEGVTLIGGSVDYGGVVFVFTGSASFQACSFSGNKAQNTVSSFLLTHLLSITFLFFLLISFFDFVFLSSSEADIFSTSLCFMLCFIYFLSFIFLSFFCRLCVGVSFLFLSSQGGAVAVRFGSAFFQACSFSQNNAVGDSVSTFVLNSFFDLLPLLFPCVCVPPPPPSIENSS